MTDSPGDSADLVERIADAVVRRLDEREKIDLLARAVLNYIEQQKQEAQRGDAAECPADSSGEAAESFSVSTGG